MSDEKIMVEVRLEYPPDRLFDSSVEPIAVVVKMRKDDFETTVQIPVGDEISSKEFALAVKALYQASVVFHHRVYDKLREKMEDLNKGFEKSPALLEKDQRGG